MDRLNAVIFDLGRVLVEVDLERGLWADLMRVAGGHAGHIGSLRDNDLLIGFHVGRIPPLAFFAEFCARTGRKMPYDEFASRWCDCFAPMPGMAELVEELLFRGMTLGILSDTDPLHFPFCCGTFPYVGRIPNRVASYEVGATKPSRAMFEAAVRAVGVPAERCLFVDDLQGNVDGAIAFGMQAVRFTGAEDLRERLRDPRAWK